MMVVGAAVRLWPGWPELDDEPDRSMEAAAEVVEAMAVADIGSGWLCAPS